jgi:hypothetical protein
MATGEPQLPIPQGDGEGRRTEGTDDERRIGGLSLVAAYAGGEAYAIYAVFVAHSLKPVSFYLSEQNPFRRAVSGAYVEVFSLDGLISILVASLAVFFSVWWLSRGAARALSRRRSYQDPELSSSTEPPRSGNRVLDYIFPPFGAEPKALPGQLYREGAGSVDAFNNPDRRSINNVRTEESNV